MVLLTFLDFSAFGAATATVTLAWDGSSDPTVVGYRLYYGGKSESYTNVLTISHATTATISNLVQGANYYFAVTAYDASGLESDFSGEVPYTVPITTSPTLTRVNITPGLNGPALVTATGTPGDIYTVLASRDFVSWETLGVAIAGLDGTVQYTDVAAVSAPLRFYRLKRTGP
jgi:fibronectin type III domain protein